MKAAHIPSREKCLTLMDKYEMFDHIKAHSLMVARVAEVIYADLAAALPAANLPPQNLVLAGAMLHDIAKSICIKKGCCHSMVGAEICLAEGFAPLAEIVAEHVYITDYSSQNCCAGFFRAKELVYYADKRVRHDKVVSLEDRMEYIIERYGKNDKMIINIKKSFALCQDMEKAIFLFLPYKPEDLAARAGSK
ncbi:MAG: metal-dependent phosphohydrolase [Deltaproteobacteria bacterium]|nr:MAG: metal-dependent phosphohydrolase [Deltaproteobacteria bacterium]